MYQKMNNANRLIGYCHVIEIKDKLNPLLPMTKKKEKVKG